MVTILHMIQSWAIHFVLHIKRLQAKAFRLHLVFVVLLVMAKARPVFPYTLVESDSWFVIAWIRLPGTCLYHIHQMVKPSGLIGMLQEEILLMIMMAAQMSSAYGLHLSEMIGIPFQPPMPMKVSIHVIGMIFNTQSYLFQLIWIRRYLLVWLYPQRSPHHTVHIPKLILMILSVEDATRGLHYCVVFELSFLIVVENSTTIYKTVIRFCCVYQSLSHLNTSCTNTSYLVLQTPSYILSKYLHNSQSISWLRSELCILSISSSLLHC